MLLSCSDSRAERQLLLRLSLQHRGARLVTQRKPSKDQTKSVDRVYVALGLAFLLLLEGFSAARDRGQDWPLLQPCITEGILQGGSAGRV